MGLTLQELIKLDEETYTTLGWNSNNMNVSCDNMDIGDIWLYCDVHPSALEKFNDLYEAFDSLYGGLKNIWGDKAKNIEFHDTDDDDNLSGYFVAIELTEIVEEYEE